MKETVFVVLILFFIGASWFFNVKIAKHQLRSETKKIFDDTNKMIDSFKEEFEYEKNYLYAENSRAFYVFMEGNDPTHIANRLQYAAECINYYTLIKSGKRVKTFVDCALIELKSAKRFKGSFNKTFKESGYSYELILQKIDLIPDELHETKQEIIQLIDELRKEDEKKQKPLSKT